MKTEIMKREYISPDMEEAVVEMEPQLVGTSVTGNATEPAHAPARDSEDVSSTADLIW